MSGRATRRAGLGLDESRVAVLGLLAILVLAAVGMYPAAGRPADVAALQPTVEGGSAVEPAVVPAVLPPRADASVAQRSVAGEVERVADSSHFVVGCVRSLDGAMVADAHIAVWAATAGGVPDQDAGAALAQTSTDRAGLFRIGPLPCGGFAVVARHPDFLPVARRVRVPHLELTLCMSRAATAKGVVVAEESGATLPIERVLVVSDREDGRGLALRHDLPQDLATWPHGTFTVALDPVRSIRVLVLAGGRAVVQSAPLTAMAAGSHFQLRAPIRPPCTGRVVDELGGVVADAQVDFVLRTEHATSGLVVESVRSGSDGSFEARPLPRTGLGLRATAVGHRTALAYVAAQRVPEPIVLGLARAAAVDIDLLASADGADLPLAADFLCRADGLVKASVALASRTTTLCVLEPGCYVVRLLLGGVAHAALPQATCDVGVGDRARLTFDLREVTWAELSGLVKTNGEPTAGAELEITNEWGGTPRRLRADERGCYSLRCLLPGRHRVSAGRAGRPLGAVEVDVGVGRCVADLSLATSDLTVELGAEHRNSIACQVEVFDSSGSWVGGGPLDAHGRLVLDDLPTGELEVVVRRGESAAARSTVRLVSGQPARAPEPVWQPAGNVAIEARFADGTRPRSMIVAVRDGDGAWAYRRRAGGAGRVVLHGLPPGEIEVVVATPDQAHAATRAVIVAGQTVIARVALGE